MLCCSLAQVQAGYRPSGFLAQKGQRLGRLSLGKLQLAKGGGPEEGLGFRF